MKLSAPKQLTFWIAVALAVLGLLVSLISSLGFASYGVWLVALGFLVLVVGNMAEGM